MSRNNKGKRRGKAARRAEDRRSCLRAMIADAQRQADRAAMDRAAATLRAKYAELDADARFNDAIKALLSGSTGPDTALGSPALVRAVRKHDAEGRSMRYRAQARIRNVGKPEDRCVPWGVCETLKGPIFRLRRKTAWKWKRKPVSVVGAPVEVFAPTPTPIYVAAI